MPTRGSKDPNGRALRGRRAHTTFALLTDPARQIWNSFNNRANAGGADAPEAAVNGCLYDRFKSLYNKTATKPSLVIVPARFKSGTLYSQIPSSNADFTVTRPLNTATRFDSSALIQTGITSGVPRLDYYISGGVTGCPALLVEPAATNLFSSSNDFLSSGWVKVRATITSGTTTSPDGTLNASTINCDASGTAGCWVRQTVALSSERTASIFVKPNTAQFFQIQRDYGRGVVFNLASGTIKESVMATGTITPFPNGWYRCTAHFSGAGETLFLVGNSSMTVISWSSNLNESLFIYEAQMEAGTIATSVIPTTAVTGSRSADTISVSGAVSGSIGQQSGTVYMELVASNLGAEKMLFQIDNGTATGRVAAFYSSDRNINFATASGSQYLLSSGSVLSLGTHKVALTYSSGNLTAYVNGAFYVSGTPTHFPSAALNNISLGSRINNGVYGIFLNDRIRAVALYTTRLTNDELATLTKL